MLNVNIDDDTPIYPNDFIQFAPISCPTLSSTNEEQTNTNLEMILNRNEIDVDRFDLLKSLVTEENLGMDDLPSTTTSFQLNFDQQIDQHLRNWQRDFDDLLLQPSSKSETSTKNLDEIPSKIRLAGLFDIPLPELKFQPAIVEQANRYAEQQLNRTYAVELNPNEKLGDFRLRVPQMAIEVCGSKFQMNFLFLTFFLSLSLSIRSIFSIRSN